MSRSTKQNLSSRVILVCVIVSGIVLGGQVIGWATSACQEPNPSTEFCTDAPQTTDCSPWPTELSCETRFDQYERKQFPDGAVSAASGTTKEIEDECLRRKYCVWNDTNYTCESGEEWSEYEPADMTVVGENPCPTCEN